METKGNPIKSMDGAKKHGSPAGVWKRQNSSSRSLSDGGEKKRDEQKNT